ncbi:hypothetical protein DITRI_Ditri13aG0048800 [Diplodiscus trichospermus]
MSRSINFLAMLVLLITASPLEEILAAPACVDVTKAVTPCLEFVRGKDGADPPPACCSGANYLAGQAKTKDDKQAICECLKGVLPNIGPYDPSRVPLIAKKCGVDIEIPPITAETDCSKL